MPESDARLTDADLQALALALVPLRHNAGWYANQCARLLTAIRAERVAAVQTTQQGECETDLTRLLTERHAHSENGDTELFGLILSNLLQVRQRNAQLDMANARLERALTGLLAFPHTPGCLQIANEHYACSCPRGDVVRCVEEGLQSRFPPAPARDQAA